MKLRSCVLLLALVYLIASPILAVDSFVIFEEVTEDGVMIPLASDQSYYNVDINSHINVRFIPNLLVPKDRVIDSPKSKQLRAELMNLTQLVQEAEQHLIGYLKDLEEIYPKLMERDNPELRARYLQVLQAHGQLIMNILDHLEPVVGLGALNQALMTSDPTYPNLLNLLSERIHIVQKQLQKEVSLIMGQSQLSLRVWCIHKASKKNPTAIHLRNYDDLQRGRFQMVDKATFRMSEEEKQHVLTNAQLYQKLQVALQNIGKQGGAIKQIADELQTKLVVDLKKIRDTVQFQKEEFESHLHQVALEIKQEFYHLPSSSELKQLQHEFDQLFLKVNGIVKLEKNFTRGVNELILTIKEDNILLQAEQFLDQLGQVKELAQQLLSQFKTTELTNLKELISKIQLAVEVEERTFSKNVLEKIQKFSEFLKKDWVPQLAIQGEQLTTLNLAGYVVIFQGLAERLSFVKNLPELSLPEEELVPKEIRDVALNDAPPTTIDIPWTQRGANDLYLFNVQVRSQNALIYDQQYTFRVTEYGLSSKWITNLAFMKEYRSVSYRPVTAVSWIMHYQRRGEGDELVKQNEILKVINPGVGITSIVYSGETQFEYGFGLSITLLDDLVQVGYGLKLLDSQEGRKDFFFVGTSLFNLISPSSDSYFD